MATVKKCLGPLLYEEEMILRTLLLNLLNKKGPEYVDAVNCEWVFNSCAKIIIKGGN